MDIEREELRRKLFPPKQEEEAIVSNSPSISPNLLKLFPASKIERIKKKSLRKFKAAQDKQWDNFLKAVSE